MAELWQEDIAYIDSLAKGEKMTAEQEEDVINIISVGLQEMFAFRSRVSMRPSQNLRERSKLRWCRVVETSVAWTRTSL